MRLLFSVALLFRAVLFVVAVLITAPASANAEPIPSSVSLDEAEKECRKALDSHQCPPAVLPSCQRAVDLAEKTLGQISDRTAAMLNNLGECSFFNGHQRQAEEAIQRGLDIRQHIWGKEHSEVAVSLANLADVFASQGKYAEAEHGHHQSLAMLQKLRGMEDPDVAQSMNDLALVLVSQGKLAEAELLNRQALAIRRKLRGHEHPEVAQSLHNLGMVLNGYGKYAEAESLHRQAPAMLKRLLGEHPDVATTVSSLASVLANQGKHAEAERFYREALAMRQKLLGNEHPSVATNLNNLASVLNDQGKYTEAESLHRHTLVMFQKLWGSEHPSVATSLINLAGVLDRQGKYVEAEVLYRQALSSLQKVLGNEHRTIAVCLGNLATALDRQGRRSEAEQFYRRALAMGKKLLGVEHPDVAPFIDKLAGFLISQSRPAEAATLLRQSLVIRERQILATVSETRTQALLDMFGKDELSVYEFLLLSADPQPVKLALEMALLRKGRGAEAGALANRLIHRNLGRPEVKQRFNEWVSVRQQREFLLLGGMGKRKPEEYQKQLQDLQIQAESLEHMLAVEVPEIRDVQPPPFDEIIAKVAQRLPPDGVLMEVVEAKPFQGYGRPDKHVWGSAHFVALLLFPDQRVVSVDLGEAKMIDALTESFRRTLASSHSHPEAAAQALYTALFDKLRDQLGGRKEIYLSLEGSLNLVPFDALHDGSDYLLGRYRFHYLTSGRDLLRKPSPQPVGPALVLGNPYFGPEWISGTADGSIFYSKLAQLVNLPWAQREVELVAKLLGVRPFLGTEAKEDVLRGRFAPWVLHLATHGIYLSDLSAWQIPGVDRSALLPLQMPGEGPAPNAPPPQRLPGEFGPMNRSGLLFAGVRQGVSVEDKTKDGLLTAEEARSLDLDGTQLVVLSACDSGMGETAPGQGVYGLRRAFLIAGAETLVSSLWRVDDKATGELMAMYYQKLLDKQKPGDRLGAMIESMQELRIRPGRSHPYYWAPFLVIGADGPLRTRQ